MKDEDKTKQELIGELAALGRRKHLEWEDIFNAIGHPTMILDPELHIIAANNATVKEIGKPLSELLGKKCREFFHFTEQPPLDCPLEKMLLSRKVETAEMEVEALDGIYLVSCTPVFDANGALQQIIHIAINVTERKRLEEALRKSEETLRLVTDNMSDMVRVIDLQGNNLFATPSHFTVLGYKPEERVGRSTLDIVHPDDIEYVVKTFSENAAGRQPTAVEYRARHADGHYVWIESTGSYVENDKGEITAVIVSGRDISKRKASEESLRISEERYRALASAVDSMYLVDGECRYLFVNDGYLKRRGITLNEIVGRRYDDFHSAEDTKVFREKVNKVYETGKPIQYEHLSEKDGKYFLRTFSPVMDQEGKAITAVTIASQNITDRKRLEAQLLQSQKMEALGTLAGGIAHDFNNILSAMIGYAELAMMDSDEKSRQSNIDQALLACDRGKKLVSQILAFSRKTSPEYKPIEVGPIVKEGLRLLKASLPSTILIRRKIAPEPCIILGNSIQIQQVLMNLCTNAAHAMGDKGGVLEIKLSPVEISSKDPALSMDLQAGSYVKLAVSDTGHGIDPAIVERIFDPFFTTKTTGEGTGLGLSVVYGIVKGHHGTVTIQSEHGKGSTFNVYFPRLQVEVKPEIEEKKMLPKGDESILFIDDETDLAKMGRMMLESLGYSVTSCTDSVEAVEEFHENPGRYDLVITDMTMPGMTGLDVANAVLKINPRMPIILCTGYSEIIDDKKAKEMGIREFLLKPVSMKVLATTVRKALDGE